MNVISIKTQKTSVGELIIGSFENHLCLMDYKYRRMRTTVDKRLMYIFQAEFKEENSNIINMTLNQLEEYLTGKRKEFEVPILMAGTDFQKKVWKELMNVPYGTTCSYLELAEKIGDKKSVRAVASANGANSMSIIIPCHRIIGSDGSLTGYAGGLAMKKKLLKLEADNV